MDFKEVAEKNSIILKEENDIYVSTSIICSVLVNLFLFVCSTILLDTTMDIDIVVYTGIIITIIVFVGLINYLYTYVDRFILKRRSREFSIYMMMGIDYEEIMQIWAYEKIFNLRKVLKKVIPVIGILDFVLVCVISCMRFFGGVSPYIISVVGSAFIMCIIYLVNIYRARKLVYKLQLIELLNMDRKAEKIRKVRISDLLLFILSVIGIVVTCRGIALNLSQLIIMELLKYMIVGIISTIIFFRYFSRGIIYIISKTKKLYYNTNILIVLGQIKKQMDRNSTMMAVISLTIVASIVLFVNGCISFIMDGWLINKEENTTFAGFDNTTLFMISCYFFVVILLFFTTMMIMNVYHKTFLYDEEKDYNLMKLQGISEEEINKIKKIYTLCFYLVPISFAMITSISILLSSNYIVKQEENIYLLIPYVCICLIYFLFVFIVNKQVGVKE